MINDIVRKSFEASFNFQKYIAKYYGDMQKLTIESDHNLNDLLPNGLERIFSFVVNIDNKKELNKLYNEQEENTYKIMTDLKWVFRILTRENMFISNIKTLELGTYAILGEYVNKKVKLVYTDDKFYQVGVGKISPQKIANLNYKIKTNNEAYDKE